VLAAVWLGAKRPVGPAGFFVSAGVSFCPASGDVANGLEPCTWLGWILVGLDSNEKGVAVGCVEAFFDGGSGCLVKEEKGFAADEGVCEMKESGGFD
jgi:hypothetical protein